VSKLDKLLAEVQYFKGEVMNDPQTWSETSISGSGGGGNYVHTSNVSISSSTKTNTSFLIETENDKEFMVKWPEALSVRKGHYVKVAVFRDQTIAFVNEKTDTRRYLSNLTPLKWWSEAKAFPSFVSYGSLAAFIVPLFTQSLQWVSGITFFIWLALLVVGLFRKGSIYKKASKNFGKTALNILEGK